MGCWVGPINSGAAVGNNGVATMNADSEVAHRGMLKAIAVKYNDSPPAGTTDVVVKTKGTHAPSITLLTLTDGATDVVKYPREVGHTTLGADLTFDGTRKVPVDIPIDDFINVKIDQANAGDSVDVWLYLE